MPEMLHHPVAELFPMMIGNDYVSLKEDIRTHGQREDIWTYEGKIIDGRNRDRACRELGVKPRMREWQGEGSVIGLVVSLNLHRRHLDETQRAVVAAKMKPMFEAEAKSRQVAHLKNGNGHPRANLPERASESKTKVDRPREQVAKLMNVSPRSVESASKVLRDGAPELVKAMERSEVPVSVAATVAELPKKRQAEIAIQGGEAIFAAATKVQQAKKELKDVIADDRKGKPTLDIQHPKNSPGQKWLNLIYQLTVIANSISRQGGLREISKKWSAGERKEAKKDLRELIDQLQGALTELEDK